MRRQAGVVFGMVFLAHAAAAQFTQQGSRLVGTGAVGGSAEQAGSSVAISADGNTAIVGGPSDNGGVGAAWVFIRSGGVWSQQGSKLVGTGAVGAASQGSSVAISADGNTAIVGGPEDNVDASTGNGTGAAWVFTRRGRMWSQQGSKLVGTGAVGAASQGSSVAISADGNIAIVGGPNDNSGAGATWVFTHSGAVWTQQGNKLVGTGAVGAASQGSSMAISADGNAAIVGGPNDSSGAGAVWVFIRSGAEWTQQRSKLVGADTVGLYPAKQGSSVAISADGNTAAVGGPFDNSYVGAVWVFTQAGGVWSQQGSKLVGTGAVGTAAAQGSSVALSSDGNTAIIGGPNDSPASYPEFGSAGAAWVFARAEGAWAQQGDKLTGSGAAWDENQGSSVAISADGATAIVGGPDHGGHANMGEGACWVQGPGSAWVYTRSGGIWSQQGSELVDSDASGFAGQGWSAAISADGNTGILGGPSDNGGVGAAWVFIRSGGVWSQQGSKLVGDGAVGPASQGTSVAISADGNTAILGGPNDNSNIGAAWVFTRSGDVWWQQGTKLVGTGAMGAAGQGSAVAISADGNTAIVGGSGDDCQPYSACAGAAWVFTRSGGAWSQQGSKLVGTGAVGPASQGASVAISADGNTAIVGGPSENGGSFYNPGAGAAWVFTRSGNVWSQQGSKLVGLDVVGAAAQGTSVGISGDGNTAIVGGPTDNDWYGSSSGAAWVYTRSGGAWSQQGSKLVGTGSGGAFGPNLGAAVAISADGNTAIVGGPNDGSVYEPVSCLVGSTGAAWVFTRSEGQWYQQGDKLVVTDAVWSQQGHSVAISADGYTAIVGGPIDHAGIGAAWVYVAGCIAPSIVEPPQDQSVQSGHAATFSVAASGRVPFSYQWYQGSTGDTSQPVGTDASTFTTAVLTASTNYWVRVSNVCGHADSATATALICTTAPSITSQPQSQALLIGPTATLSVSASGSTPLSYQWYRGASGDTSFPVGTNASSFTTPALTADTSYWVRVSNACGYADSATATITLRPYSVWVPVASHNGGLNHSQWRSDLGLLNTGTAMANVRINFFGSSGVVSDASAVPAGTQSIVSDVVGQLPTSGSGALEILSDQPLKVTARTYNQVSSTASCYPNGTQGQDYPAVVTSDGLVTGQSAYLAGLTENASYRTNIGLVNVGTDTATVLVELLDGAGTKLGDYSLTLTAGQWLQETQPFFNKAAQVAMDRGYARITVQSGSGVFGFASVIDNLTNDPTTIAMQLVAQFAQQGAKLVGTGGAAPSWQGRSVAISGDGDTAIVGGPADNASAGAAWLYTRSGGVWSQQGNKLVGTGAVGGALEGYSAAISADGNTAIIGGLRDNGNPFSAAGAAWVFTRNGGVWSQQGSKLVGTGAVGYGGQQGISVAISGDGNTAIVGGYGDNTFVGAAWAFTRSGGVWSQQGSKLVGTGAVGYGGQQGISVAISGDGNTAIVGGPADNAYAGAAWLYTRSGGVWSQQGDKLVGINAVGPASQGASVAISADGNTAIVGGPNDNSGVGSTWVFTRSGGVWSQQGNKLVGINAVGPASQGASVAISADGNTAMVGGWQDNSNIGATWVFTRSGGVWMQQGSKLVGTAAVGPAGQGSSVAISADGNTFIIGGPFDNGNPFSAAGAAWVFSANTFAVWVPVASHTSGLNGSQWRSDLGLLNTGSVTASAQITFFGSGGAVSITEHVPSGTQSVLTDVVGQLGAIGSAALEIVSDQPLKVTARTYNEVASDASCDPNGTQGQDYPALAVSDGLIAGQSAYLAGLSENGSYRCNIGLVNTGTESATVLVELFDGAGTSLANYTVLLAAGQWLQETQPFFHKAGQTAMDSGYAKITVQTGSGVFAFASVIDNLTNDPTTVAMQR